jgi:hypothetical protein
LGKEEEGEREKGEKILTLLEQLSQAGTTSETCLLGMG